MYIVKAKIPGCQDYLFDTRQEALDAYELLDTCSDEMGLWHTGAYHTPEEINHG